MTSVLVQALDALRARIRPTPSGGKSLAHIAVIVPTAESGRRLRRALAREWGALIPPRIETPWNRLYDGNDPALATRTDEIRAMEEGKDEERKLERARMLVDLRTILAPKALSFADVAQKLKTDFPEEAARWEELAAIEEKYRARLAARGKRDKIDAMKAFRPKTDGIEETLDFSDPAALRPSPSPVPRTSIFPCATPADEAEKIAAYFASVKPTEAWPALCVADPELFPEIETAFKAKGLSIHNPAVTKVVTSSLGHLVEQIVSLLHTPSYSVFSAFIRGGDVRRWLKRELRLSDDDLTRALVELDNAQANYLPEKIDDVAPKTTGTLRGIFEFVKVQLRKKTLRGILASIFKDFILDEREPSAREFAAAAEVVNALIEECGDDRDLFELRLKESTYSLEPDEGDVILTDGWMELPFLDTREIVIAGFQEGCVPESTVGHPYLPNALRAHLGLPDNARKEARDRAILAFAVGTRQADEVKVFFHAIDAKGDVQKPSRLLFETPDDEDLLARVNEFYGVRAGSPERAVRDLPSDWKLKLPIPPERREIKKIAPTRLDSYLKCPFTFYLKDKTILGDKRMDDRAEELQSWEYGNLAHKALEAFGLSELKNATDPEKISAFLERKVDEQLVERFGTAIPVIVALQGESIKNRLRHFAEIQAKRAASGWTIHSVERTFELQFDHTRLYGKCDRIDYREETDEWCVIDYKTWDKLDKIPKPGESLQLPIYCAMLDAANDPDLVSAKRDRITSLYCVLGKTKDAVAFTTPASGELIPEAEQKIRALIDRIERGIFWPPAATREWQYDYGDWLAPSPKESVNEEWIRDQERRLGS